MTAPEFAIYVLACLTLLLLVSSIVSWTLIGALWLRLDASERRAVLTERGLL